MILVIPLRNNGSYEQLRFALRSITTHHDITRCILVGGKPTWYTGDHIFYPDYGPVHKEKNIRDKVLAVVECIKQPDDTIVGKLAVSDKFLFANDDHILMQPITTTYNKGLLSTCLAARSGNGSYTCCLRNTFNHYGDVPNVDTHCPMFMTGEGVLKTQFQWPDFGIGFKTCYAQENSTPSTYMEDCKVGQLPTGRAWFSMNDGFNPQILTQYFPQRSIFEV